MKGWEGRGEGEHEGRRESGRKGRVRMSEAMPNYVHPDSLHIFKLIAPYSTHSLTFGPTSG